LGIDQDHDDSGYGLQFGTKHACEGESVAVAENS
jgi:hypothetical protein